MAENPEGPDRDVVRPRREGGIAKYPIIILAVVVIVAIIGIIVTL